MADYEDAFYRVLSEKESLEESALIEKLGAALKWSWGNLYSMADPAKVIDLEEALADLTKWRKK